MTNQDELIRLLKETFPNAKISEHAYLFSNEVIDDYSRIPVADQKEQIDRLDQLEKSLQDAGRHFRALHPVVRDVLDDVFYDNSIERLDFAPGTTLVVDKDPVKRAGRLSNILAATLYSLTGRRRDTFGPTCSLPKQTSALEEAKDAAKRLSNLSGKAQAEEAPQKVGVVLEAIDCWLLYAGVKPGLTSKSFLDFLQGLIYLRAPDRKHEWDARNLIRTYKRFRAQQKLAIASPLSVDDQ